MRSLLLLFSSIVMTCTSACAEDSTAGKVRVATFNIAMGLDHEGDMAAALSDGSDERLQQVSEILQRVRPDIVLLNEFDYDPGIDAAGLFNRNYLGKAQRGRQPIAYPYHYRAPVNTGIDSGLDLDRDGKTGGPGDAWGFGHFPGQYGMLILSRFPLVEDKTRTLQDFRWARMPGALRPVMENGEPFHPDEIWAQLRLSSKSHWDVVFDVGGHELHLLAHHPTPPVFDGPEDRNGRRNFDEIRLWRDYTDPQGAPYIVDDNGKAGGLEPGARFVIAGDFNADPFDGDSVENAIGQLLEAPWINSSYAPSSTGAIDAAREQGGINGQQAGDPAYDTADFNDRYTGNLRLDYLLPSAGLNILGGAVFWPAYGLEAHDPSGVSDHRLVWLDIEL
jgi:endonuclease/exonuclease/phosphatase family metal-dependent hydrolase